MTARAATSALAILATLLCVGEGYASAQIFPSDKMTAVFTHEVDSFAAKNGAAFVSRCEGPGNGEIAILIVPLGTHDGLLTLLASGKVYNDAGLEIKGGNAAIVEGGGGEWSMRRLQFYADTLMRSEFQLDFPVQLHSLLTAKSKNTCPEFKDSR